MQGVVKMRKWRQLFIIDIAVPRDVDPRVESLRNVFLYDMDDLKRVVAREPRGARARGGRRRSEIVDEEVAQLRTSGCAASSSRRRSSRCASACAAWCSARSKRR